jgi:hypothetical protein
MKKVVILVVLVLAVGFGFWWVRPGETSALTISGEDVLLKTENLDVHFDRKGSFDETYMMFGGIALDQKDAVAKVGISGINVKKAKPIADRYPDFYMCNSPGAAIAKKAVADLDLVPADGTVFKDLKSAIADFESSIHGGGERVCVHLEGTGLELKSVGHREAEADLTDDFKKAFSNHHLFMITTAEIVDCQEAMNGA